MNYTSSTYATIRKQESSEQREDSVGSSKAPIHSEIEGDVVFCVGHVGWHDGVVVDRWSRGGDEGCGSASGERIDSKSYQIFSANQGV